VGVAGDAGSWPRARGAGAPRRLAAAAAAALAHPLAPAVVLALATVVVGGLAALLGRGLVTITLDEALFKASAAHYAYDGLPGALFDDVSARATARLYPLWLTPFVALLPGDLAVAAGRAANGPLFASACVPLYLLGRQLLASRWAAVAAAVAGVAVPWIAISAVLYSENLAYPLFAWALLAITLALRRPAPWRDLLAVVALVLLLGTRTQFVALLPAYLVLVLVRVRRDARAAGLGPADWTRGLRLALRRFPVSLAGAVVAAVALAVLAAGDALSDQFRRVGGSYSEIQSRTVLPQDVGLASLFEVVALGLGTGVVPIVLAAAWVVHALQGRHGALARDLVAGAGVLLGVLFAVTMAAQSGFLGENSEERYYVYAVPLVWIAALAALEGRRLAPRAVAVAGAVFVALCACVPLATSLSPQSTFLAPATVGLRSAAERASTALGDATGFAPFLTPRDLVALAALAVVVPAAVVWRRAPRARAAVLVAAAALQLAVTGYAFAVVRGAVPGLPGQVSDASPAALAWIDRAVPGDGPVAWLLGARQPAPLVVETLQRSTLFWNDQVRLVHSVPAAGGSPKAPSLGALGDQALAVGADGRLAPEPPHPDAVVTPDSPFVQLAGPLRPGRDGLALQRLERPARATWLATGLAETGLPAGADPVGLQAFTAPARVTLRFAGAHDGPTSLRVRLGGREQEVAFAGHEARAVTVGVCPGPGQRGSIEVVLGAPAAPGGPPSAAALTAVEVRPGPCR
jgi:hypothetical protein